MILSAIAISILIIYLVFIGLLVYGFDKVDDFKLQDLPAKTKLSVLIPFRNEAENLPHLLDSISELNYPESLYEIIFIDDASEDDSVLIIEKFLGPTSSEKEYSQNKTIRIIKNKRTSNSAKKDAITCAIAISKFNWIVTTDADCILPKYWLDAFDECIQTKNTNCIVAPVTYYGQNSFFKRFQILDFLSLQGATLGGFGIKKPFLSNGANFAYRKVIFKKLDGFDGNSQIASGDDIFLLEKFLKHNSKKVHYLKTKKAMVITNPVKTFSELIQQRLRWASKTSKSSNLFAKALGLSVFLANFLCISFIPLVLFNLISLKIVFALFSIKFSIDFLLLFKITRFFKQESVLLSYKFSSLLYPFFNVYIVLLSVFESYQWKGRTFKK